MTCPAPKKWAGLDKTQISNINNKIADFTRNLTLKKKKAIKTIAIFDN